MVGITFLEKYNKQMQDKISVTIDYKECKNQNYRELENKFKSLGFNNIEIIAKRDLVTGWIDKEGNVEKVLINNKKFKKGDLFSKEAKIEIFYHSFKKK